MSKNKVGRPQKENALTGAERQRKYLENKKNNEKQKIEIEAVRNLISEVKKIYEDYYFRSVDDETKKKNYASAAGITFLEIKFEQLIKAKSQI